MWSAGWEVRHAVWPTKAHTGSLACRQQNKQAALEHAGGLSVGSSQLLLARITGGSVEGPALRDLQRTHTLPSTALPSTTLPPPPALLSQLRPCSAACAPALLHAHLAVKAPGPLERGVQRLSEVGGRHHDHALVGLKSILRATGRSKGGSLRARSDVAPGGHPGSSSTVTAHHTGAIVTAHHTGAIVTAHHTGARWAAWEHGTSSTRLTPLCKSAHRA